MHKNSWRPILENDRLWIGLILIGCGLFFHEVVFQGKSLITSVLDNVQCNLPYYFHLIDSLKQDHAIDPWNPYIWGGFPAIGNPNVPLTPLIYLSLFLGRPGFLLAMSVHSVFEFSLAATGAYFLLRSLNHSRWLALLGTLLYAVSTSAMITIGVLQIFFQFAAIPWVIYFLVTYDQRSSYRNGAAFTVFFYYQITYGQLQMNIYSGIVYVFALLWLAGERRLSRRTLQCLGISSLLAVALASHYWLPLLDFLKHHSEKRLLVGRPETYLVPWQYFLNLFVPGIFWPTLEFWSEHATNDGWWPRWSDGRSLWESYFVYFGICGSILWSYTLLRTVLGARRLPAIKEARILALCCLAIFFLSSTRIGVHLLSALHFNRDIPLTRITQFLVFPLIGFSLIGLRWIYSDREEMKKFIIWYAFISILVLGLVLGGMEWIARGFYDSTSRPYRTYEAFLDVRLPGILYHLSERLALLCCLLVPLLLSLAIRKEGFRRAAIALMVVVGGCDLLIYSSIHRPRGKESYPYEEILNKKTAVLTFLRGLPLGEDFYVNNPVRVRRESGVVPNELALYSIPSVNGYSSVVPRRNRLESRGFGRSNSGRYVMSPAISRVLSVKYSVINRWDLERYTNPAQKGYRVLYVDPLYAILETETPLPRFYFPEAIAKADSIEELNERIENPNSDLRKLSYSNNPMLVGFNRIENCRPSLTVAKGTGSEHLLEVKNPCAQPVVLAMNLPMHPWWRIELDGKRAASAELNGGPRGLFVPPGTHRISTHCEALSVIWGQRMSLFTAAFLVAWLLQRLRFRLRLILNQRLTLN